MLILIFAFGAIAEIASTFSRKPLFNRTVVMASLAAIAVIGTLAWMQNMLTAPIGIGWMYYAMLMALAPNPDVDGLGIQPIAPTSAAITTAWIGREATLGAFMTEARKQSRALWKQEFTARAAGDYFREGFGVVVSMP